MINEVIETFKAYTDGKDNTGKVEISVMQLNRIIKALEQQPTDAVDRVTIKEYLDSFGKETNVTTTSELSSIRHELSPSYNGVKTELEPCEDCISREETLEALMDEWTEYDRELIGWLYDKIDKLPSVTPQPKMGRWKRINKEKYVQHAMSYYRCSECGKDMIGTHNYCPNCGCEMQEVKA